MGCTWSTKAISRPASRGDQQLARRLDAAASTATIVLLVGMCNVFRSLGRGSIDRVCLMVGAAGMMSEPVAFLSAVAVSAVLFSSSCEPLDREHIKNDLAARRATPRPPSIDSGPEPIVLDRAGI